MAKLPLVAARRLPHVGVGRLTPKPRNDSADSVRIAAATVRVVLTMIGPIAVRAGRALKMMRRSSAPEARAASTNSFSFKRQDHAADDAGVVIQKNSDRTMITDAPGSPMPFRPAGSSGVPHEISTTSNGMRQEQVRHPHHHVVEPSRRSSPPGAPMIVPMTVADDRDREPDRRARSGPRTRLGVNWSRPSASVPNQCAPLGPWSIGPTRSCHRRVAARSGANSAMRASGGSGSPLTIASLWRRKRRHASVAASSSRDDLASDLLGPRAVELSRCSSDRRPDLEHVVRRPSPAARARVTRRLVSRSWAQA